KTSMIALFLLCLLQPMRPASASSVTDITKEHPEFFTALTKMPLTSITWKGVIKTLIKSNTSEPGPVEVTSTFSLVSSDKGYVVTLDNSDGKSKYLVRYDGTVDF